MTITQSSTRLVATAAGAVVALGLVFGAIAAPVHAAALSQTQIQAIVSLLQSFGADAATINNVQASLNGQPTTGTTGGTTTGGSCAASFTRNLTVGSTGSDVMALQQFLNKDAATMVSASGAGSPGHETSTFGPATKGAVVKFQAKYSISPTSGYVGPLTRAKLNSLCGSGTTTGGTTPTPTAGTGLSVSAAAQPANGLAPANASRIPFTNFTVTAGNDGDVTLNSVTVERQGVASDASFSGVELVDLSTGVQIGTSRTLNSNHQATIGDPIVIPRGTSKTFTVAANRTTAGSHAGELATFAVVAVNSSATVTGSLPIMGATQTINESLTIGAVSTSTSTFDPGAAQNKNLGDTGVRFSGVRFTANSAEDLRLYSIRWRQVGSVSSSDLANMVTVINGTSYPATVDLTGKYLTSTFPGGVLITKGNSVDAYIQGDIVGSNAASRTVDFDIDKVTDVYFIGQLYGYGVAPSGTFTPWYNGNVITVQSGTATTISKATEVPAQNIAVNVGNQVFGGFVADFKGEPVSVQTMTITIATSSGFTGNGPITSISLVDENGHVVAGPVDEASTCTTGCTVTFPDTVTFPTGRHVYTVKGKIPSGVSNNSTVIVSTNPSSWSGVTGQTSGNSISISQSTFAMNTMTVKAGALAVAVSATPAAQNIVAGSQGFAFANIQLDASQSGEDVRLSSIPVTFNLGTNSKEGNPGNLSSCQLYDGSASLTGGSNVVNPTSVATSTTAQPTMTFTFDNSLTVAKGTVKNLSVKCNLSSTADASSQYQVGMTAAQMTALSVTGISSSATITATGSTGNGQVMTVASTGSAVASTDSSSPSYTIAAANQAGVTLGVFKLRATNENVNLNRIGLKLTNAASSSPQDLTQVSLYQGTTLIGTATFVGSNTHATSSLSTPLVLTRDTDVAITVKGDIANMGTSQPATAGHLIAVDIDTNGTNTEGTGAQSGSTVDATGSTAVSGVRIFKSFPVLAKDTVPTNTLSNGTQTLLRFKVTANAAGDVGIGKVTLQISTTTAVVTSVNVYAFTDSSYSTPVSGLRSDGALLASDLANVATAADIQVVASTPVQVPAGQTRYFAVMGTVSGAAANTSVQTQLQGDAAYPSLSGFLDTLSNIDADTNDDFIWSPNTTGTAAVGDSQWTNGFGLIGLPSSNMGAEVLSK